MNLKRKVAGHIVALLAVLAAIICLQRGWIAVTEISAAIAFALVGLATGGLYWAWKPEINLWFAERNQPNLTILVTDLKDLKDEERISEVEVRLRDGKVRRHEGRFFYITVRNSGRRSAEDVEAYCPSYSPEEQMVFMPLRKRLAYTIDYNRSAQAFDEEEARHGAEAFVFALLREYRWPRKVSIHPGPKGETFVLFFTLKDYRLLTVPGPTRIYPNFEEGMPCAVTLYVVLQGKDMRHLYTAAFKVTLESWSSFKVEQIEQTVRRPLS
jgi:hypothetical protein